jgi:hypothetical protein
MRRAQNIRKRIEEEEQKVKWQPTKLEKILLVLFLISVVLVGSLTFQLAQRATPGSLSDVYVYPAMNKASYIIGQYNSTHYYAKNGTTGNYDFLSTDAAYVINSALTALPGSGEIFLKAGVYPLGTSQIVIPTGAYGADIALIGEVGVLPYCYEHRSTSSLKDTIITYDGASAITVAYSATYEPMPHIVLRNLRFRATSHTNYVAAVDLTYAMGATLQTVTFDVDWDATTTLPKTNSNGLLTGTAPYGNIVLDEVYAYGYYNGFHMNADLITASHIESGYCWNGIKTDSGQSDSYTSYHAYACVNGFLGKGATGPIQHVTFVSPMDEFYAASWMPDNTYSYMWNTQQTTNLEALTIIEPSFPAGVGPDYTSYNGGFGRGIRNYALNSSVLAYIVTYIGKVYGARAPILGLDPIVFIGVVLVVGIFLAILAFAFYRRSHTRREATQSPPPPPAPQ